MGKTLQGDLIVKLDAFIRKYYVNQLIRGSLYALGGFLIFFLSVSLLEHFGRFSTGIRTALFFTLITFSGFILIKYILFPLAKLNRLGKVISYEQAAEIIGVHFSNVQDKLINVLQLSGGATMAGSEALLYASIEQKTEELRPVPFTAAINLNQNRRYGWFAGLPLLVLLVLIGIAPQVITESAQRIVDYNTYYAPPAPFSFKVLNGDLNVPSRSDLVLEVAVSGTSLPAEVLIAAGPNSYRMQKEDARTFRYHFKNITESFAFRLTGAGISSEKYQVTVVPRPTLLGFQVNLDYPAYTGREDEALQSVGDLEIPAGTRVTWNFNTESTEALSIAFLDTTIEAESQGGSRFGVTRRFLKPDAYNIALSNDSRKEKNETQFNIQVVPDQFPRIQAEQQADSLSPRLLYFSGSVADDYGVKAAYFVLNVSRNGEDTPEKVSIPLKGSGAQHFYHMFDFSRLTLEPGDKASYYFEVWDNDAVHGSKSARTPVRIFRAPTLQELANKSEAGNQQMKGAMKSTIEEARQMQKELQELQKKLLDKPQPGWEDKKKLEDLLKKQKNIEKSVQELSKQMEQQFREMQEYSNPSPELMEKQKMIEELMNQVLSEEMKKMMEDLQKMMEKLNQQNMQEATEEMKLNNKDVEKELDRALELFKQMEVEQKAEQIREQLEKLAEKQEKLAEKTLDKKEDKDALKEEQEKIAKEFDDLQKQKEELEKKNQELEQPLELSDTEKQEEAVNQEMDKGKQELEKNNRSKASDNQKNAAQKMQEMADQMQADMQSAQQEQQGEDLQAMRQLLENLITLSVDQEKVMEAVKSTERNGPAYNKLAQQQRKLKDDAKMIEDSLFALSKRVPQIDPLVNREMTAINSNMEKSLGFMQERQVPLAAERQQLIMTSTNNLALLMSEAVKQMQQQMQQQQQGQGACSKPGSSGKPKQPSASQMRQMQQQINQQMQQLKERMEKEGGNQKGPRGQGGSMSEELVKLAAKQQAIRQYMQQMSEQLNEKNGGGKGGSGELSKKMEETETDLVNKRITQETLKRQQEILTRLLEAEKAEREREMDPKRESREATPIEQSPTPERFFEYKRKKEQEEEMLRTIPPGLLPFYKNKVNEYFNHLEE